MQPHQILNTEHKIFMYYDFVYPQLSILNFKFFLGLKWDCGMYIQQQIPVSMVIDLGSLLVSLSWSNKAIHLSWIIEITHSLRCWPGGKAMHACACADHEIPLRVLAVPALLSVVII